MGLARIVAGQLDNCIDLLGGAGAPGGTGVQERAAHETRKAIKRVRAIVRLLREELGEARFRREDAALRQIAESLGEERDSEVLLATLQALVERHPRKLGRRRGVARLRERLRSEHERAARRLREEPAARALLIMQLRTVRARAAGWQLPAGEGIGLIEPGLRSIYAQGRERRARAASGRGDRTRRMHEWRKRVKDLRYATELLQRRAQTDERTPGWAQERAELARRNRRLRRTAGRADELGEVLGEEHDLAMLDELVRTGRRKSSASPARGLSRGTRRALRKAIARRRGKLRRRALRIGDRLYEESPKRFLRNVRRAHAASLGAARRLPRAGLALVP